MADLFDIRQKEGEPLKEYLNRFYEVSVCVLNLWVKILVDAFVKGLWENPFSGYLIKERAMSMTEV